VSKTNPGTTCPSTKQTTGVSLEKTVQTRAAEERGDDKEKGRSTSNTSKRFILNKALPRSWMAGWGRGKEHLAGGRGHGRDAHRMANIPTRKLRGDSKLQKRRHKGQEKKHRRIEGGGA